MAKQGLRTLLFLYYFLQNKYIFSLRISMLFVTQSVIKNHRHVVTFKTFSIQLWINQEGNRHLDIFSWLPLALRICTNCKFDQRLTWLPEQRISKFIDFTYEIQIRNSIHKRWETLNRDILLSLWSKGKSSSEQREIEKKSNATEVANMIVR